jgi:F-type H+-transporting ATPase subunit a
MVDVGSASHHVQDSACFELPFGWRLDIPQPPPIFGYQFHLTKFMVLELVIALGMLVVFTLLARQISGGRPPRGRLWNMFEMMLVFIRDEMVRPAIGHHDADRFLPYLWTAFFFVLLCNLIGLLPWAGSPTGALAVTAAMATIALCIAVGAGMRKLGPLGVFKGQIPHMDVPFVLAIFLYPMILVIEVGGLLIKHVILAVRLLANMFAGHLVLAVILGFIVGTAHTSLWYGVMPASIFGAVALSLLELLVAFLQAYIFTFLSALFIGMVMHPH